MERSVDAAEPAFACGDRGKILGAADELLRDRAGWRRRALQSVRIECGTLAVLRCSQRGARRCRRGAIVVEPLFQRLGHQDAGRGRTALQPDVLSQWLDLAARYVGVCCRLLTLRGPRRGGPDPDRHLRNGESVRHAPAGAVLRVSPDTRPGARTVSGRLPA